MPRPFRLFSAYDFFSVFVPGLATTFSLYLLIPQNIEVSFTSVLIPTLLLAFIFGQALHAFSAFLHNIGSKYDIVKSHREIFAEMIEDSDDWNGIHINKFKQAIVQFDGTPEMQNRMYDGLCTQEWETLYTVVQSQVYNYGQGRSISFQAIYAFSRSMSVLLFGLLPLFYVHHYAQEIGLFQRDPLYMEFFPTFHRLMEAAVPLCIIGGLLFLISTFSYRRNFVKYLISDFIIIRDDKESDKQSSRYGSRLN